MAGRDGVEPWGIPEHAKPQKVVAFFAPGSQPKPVQDRLDGIRQQHEAAMRAQRRAAYEQALVQANPTVYHRRPKAEGGSGKAEGAE